MEITQLPVAATIDAVNDTFPIVTNSLNATQQISRNTFLGLASQPVGISDTQTLTAKTLTSPIISGPTLSGTLTGTYTIGGTPTFPSSVVTLTGSQTLTNKILTSPTINTATISNPTLTVDTISGYTTSTNVTAGGVTLQNGAVGGTSGTFSTTLSVTGNSTLSGTTTSAGLLTASNGLTVSSGASALGGALTVTGTTGLTGQLSVQTGTAPPAAGATTSGIKVSSTANFGIFWGSGAPTFSAAQGSIYLRTDGSSTSTRLYANTTGSTTWTSFTSAA